MKIILDTNFLVYCAKQKIDYKEGIDKLVNDGYELVVISPVVKELRELSERAKKFSEKQAAKLALALLKHNKVKIMKAIGNADLEIIKMSKGNIVATLDKEIRRRAGKSITISTGKKMRLIG